MNREAPSELHQQLDACVRELRDEMIDFTSELVAVASENPPGSEYPECVRVIESRLRALGLPSDRVPSRPQRNTPGRIGRVGRDEQRRLGQANVVFLRPLRRGAGHDAGSMHPCPPR